MHPSEGDQVRRAKAGGAHTWPDHSPFPGPRAHASGAEGQQSWLPGSRSLGKAAGEEAQREGQDLDQVAGCQVLTQLQWRPWPIPADAVGRSQRGAAPGPAGAVGERCGHVPHPHPLGHLLNCLTAARGTSDKMWEIPPFQNLLWLEAVFSSQQFAGKM